MRLEEVIAEVEARKAAEAKAREAEIERLYAPIRRRQEQEERERKAEEQQLRERIKASNEAELRSYLRSQWTGSDEDFEECYPELKKQFLIAEALKGKRRHPVYDRV